MISRQAGIISIEVGWTSAETRARNEAERSKRKETDEIFKVVAQTNEKIFYIGWWLEYFEEELIVNRSSDVSETRAELRMDTYPPSFI